MASREANKRTGVKPNEDRPSEDWVAKEARKRVLNYTVDQHTGCWEHNKKPDSKGYISLNYRDRNGYFTYRAHRLSFIIHCGPIIEDYAVNHRCDNRICVNPLHLYQGTSRQNMQDKTNRYRGKPTGVPQLTEDEIGFAIVLYERGLSQRAIADIFGVSPNSVGVYLRRYGIKKGERR